MHTLSQVYIDRYPTTDSILTQYTNIVYSIPIVHRLRSQQKACRFHLSSGVMDRNTEEQLGCGHRSTSLLYSEQQLWGHVKISL